MSEQDTTAVPGSGNIQAAMPAGPHELREDEKFTWQLSKQPHSADPMLQWFEYEHLPPHLQAVSAPFCTLAHRIVRDLPRNPERTVALRKLLEAKDAGVRALLYKP